MRYLTEHELPPTPEYYRQAWRALGGSVAHTALGPLLAEAVRQLDVVHRHWTLARKKQALVRVLGSADDELLGVRLRSLVESWRRAPDDTAVETESGAAHAAGVPPALAGLSALLTAVCETVPRLVENKSGCASSSMRFVRTWGRSSGHPIRATWSRRGFCCAAQPRTMSGCSSCGATRFR